MSAYLKNIAGKAGIVVAVLAAIVVGYLVRGAMQEPAPAAAEEASADTGEEETQWWTCSMHPQIRQPRPGQCPICAMDLIPVSDGGAGGGGARRLTMSEGARRLAEIETSPVQRQFVTRPVRLVGKVDYDEQLVRRIAAWVPGRLDRLYVDFTGTRVREGEHLVYLYSPELISAQEELLQALKSMKELEGSEMDFVRSATRGTVEAAREKLRLSGLTREQIKELEETGKPQDHLTIYAPIGGTVIHKHAREGMYVKTGDRIYTIADLSHVWIRLDAYESDMSWVRYGQEVEFTVEAMPGRKFTGKISFVDPILNERTRTVKVRVDVPNPDGRLKPGMFVRAVVRATIGEGGRVRQPDMGGKWMCPMHPSVVKEDPGDCTICGMPLERAETLPFVDDAKDMEPPLVIPATAPLITGERAVAYVEVPDRKKPTYEGREIVLGPRAGDYYVVAEGLEEGERVVTRGNFKIDSALQIQAKPSMMSPEDEEPEHRKHARARLEAPEQLAGLIGEALQDYYALQEALVAEDVQGASGAARALRANLESADVSFDDPAVEQAWRDRAPALRATAGTVVEADGIAAQRKHFAHLSGLVHELLVTFGVPGDEPIYVLHCPMAFDNEGADWLQPDRETRNPFYGAKMLKCGEVVHTLKPQREESEGGMDND